MKRTGKGNTFLNGGKSGKLKISEFASFPACYWGNKCTDNSASYYFSGGEHPVWYGAGLTVTGSQHTVPGSPYRSCCDEQLPKLQLSPKGFSEHPYFLKSSRGANTV